MNNPIPQEGSRRAVINWSILKHARSILNRDIYHPTAAATDMHERPNRLGKAELGPHAYEDRMPRWLIRVLEDGDKLHTQEVLDLDGQKVLDTLRVVETPNLVTALAKISEANPDIAQAIYCCPSVHHVAKLRREGSFCGYRNIQMMISYLQNSKIPLNNDLDHSVLPSIFELQKMIEEAWKRGFNSTSKDEIGNLWMTRKFIGTSEAEALFLSLGLSATTKSFVTTGKSSAYHALVQHVISYFSLTNGSEVQKKVAITTRPPIFLQRLGHSMTIVGVDQDVNGSYTLLVFDPKFPPTEAVKKFVFGTDKPKKPGKLLKAYRYGPSELAKYDAFEVVEINGHDIVPDVPICGT